MKMSQQMKLAPRMIQSMEILQLPLMALKERIDPGAERKSDARRARRSKPKPARPPRRIGAAETANARSARLPKSRSSRKNWSSIRSTTTKRTSSGC